ncbi:uncharacterized protein G2W53_001365 [Senna tora]|uniref:Uncharacterized protein n=1 Tax=Senna tora TaxID=362788 RepID=A0A834XHE5_9FABA|nr:uncharacterized protein G2W53_001365 [Senna tora]
MCCCTCESKRSLPVVFENPSAFNARMGLKKKYKFKRVVAQLSQTDRFALYLEASQNDRITLYLGI